MSRSLRKLLHPDSPGEATPAELDNELARLRSAWHRAEQLATRSDKPVAFVAGEGARIYSLDAFRKISPDRPKAA